LFVSLAGYLLAMRINQSAVVGVILAGIIVGPSFLRLITYTDFVSSIAQLGAIILLFVIGLEFKLKEILKFNYFIIALAGVIVPWIGGFILANIWGFNFSATVIIGTALTATSIAITANVLKEMGKLKTEAAKAIIGSAVIDDILGLLVLSISTSAIKGTFSLVGVLLIAFKAVAFLVIGGLIGYFLINKLVRTVDRTKIAMKYPEFVFIMALMFAFSYALLAELLGLSAIVGAFIAGVSLEGIFLKHSKSYHEGTEYLYIIFASIFFVSLGVLVNLKEMTIPILIFSLVLTIVAIITKLIGCGVPGLFQKLGLKDALALGFGMSPRGEVAMIVALLGLSAGYIGQDVYISIVIMSLLTTIITPIVLRNWVYVETKRMRLLISEGKVTIK
jgi:Kef-type K+ transport system membrane component KefB